MNENLHSNMSAAKIERIVKGYPGNRLPRGWIDAAQKVEEIQTGKDPENEGEEYPSASSKWIVLDSVLAGQMLDKRAAFFPESSALERMEQLALLDASLASNVLLKPLPNGIRNYKTRRKTDRLVFVLPSFDRCCR